MEYAWTCSCCGEQQNELPLDWTAEAPAPYSALSDEEKASRGQLTSRYCRVDDQDYVRGQICLSIHDTDESVVWSIWVSVSAESMARIRNAIAQDVYDEAPCFGWLCNTLPPYPQTMALKTNVHFHSRDELPVIELQDPDHPLAIEQREGITIERAVEIAEMLLPRH